MTPGAEPAFSDAFFALLLCAGVSESIENEIACTDYAVYDSADTMERIDEVSRRLPNDGAGTKASVNRHGQEMDPATVAAVKMANVMAEVNRTAVVYSGALAELMTWPRTSQKSSGQGGAGETSQGRPTWPLSPP